MLIYCAVLAVGVSIVSTFAVAKLLTTLELTDQPDGNRKLHTRAVPRLGGIAICLAVSVTMFIEVRAGYAGHLPPLLELLFKVTPGSLLMLAVGMTDDLVGLQARLKLVVQIGAAILAVSLGVQFGGSSAHGLTGLGTALLTVLWIVLFTNAFNLIDGVDGLAAGIGVIFAVAISLAAIYRMQMEVAILGLTLAGGLLGFLVYNFSPASIFLGDSGSLTVGYLLGCLSILWSNREPSFLGKFAPVIGFAVPLGDLFLSVLRRYLRGRPIFSADRGHIHHRLLLSGLSSRRVALLLYLATATVGVIGLSQIVLPAPKGLIVLLALLIGIRLAIWKLNYIEFRAASDLIRQFCSTRSYISSYIAIDTFKGLARQSASFEEYWLALRRAAAEFGFDRVELIWFGVRYEDGTPSLHGAHTWSHTLPISETDSLTLQSSLKQSQTSGAYVAFLKAIHDDLHTRRKQFETPLALTAPLKARSVSALSR